jgi:hypothetical protein
VHVTNTRFDNVDGVLHGVVSKQVSLEAIMQQLASGQIELQQTCRSMDGSVEAMRSEFSAVSRSSDSKSSTANPTERSPYGAAGNR